MRLREISEDEVTTTQEPQCRTTTQGPPRRYPIALRLCDKATSKEGPLHGFGQTRTMSSQDITFGPGDGLQPGMNAEIAIARPSLLEGRICLQLLLEAIITRSQNGLAEARILAYDFRTPAGGSAAQNGTGHHRRDAAGDRIQFPAIPWARLLRNLQSSSLRKPFLIGLHPRATAVWECFAALPRNAARTPSRKVNIDSS
jgi:hypothetical protein